VPRPKSKPVPIGRPRSRAAVSHAAILDAVSHLLQEMPARDLTMDAIAKRAGVGKPTLYKWWPSKAALILAMFHDRFSAPLDTPKTTTTEKALRLKLGYLIAECNGLFGKVVADLIAEGQADPTILKDLYENHIRVRRGAIVADIESGIASGELSAQTNPNLLIDAIVAPIYLRLLLRSAPLTTLYGNQLIDQAMLAVRTSREGSTKASRIKPSPSRS
jgi:AcrR family transcriptional regulator